MEIIKLQGLEELKKKENLTEIPELVQRYLNADKGRDSRYGFKMSTYEKSSPVDGAGIAYHSILTVKKDEQTIFTVGGKWRNAYGYQEDNFDLHIVEHRIIDNVYFGFSTGAGNIKVVDSNTKIVVLTFNMDEYKKTQARITLLQRVLDDSDAFLSYIDNSLTSHWHIGHLERLSDNIVVLLNQHSDSDYDAVSDLYQIYFWVKGKGIGVTDRFSTELYHPRYKKNYRIRARSSASLFSEGENFVEVLVEMSSKQKWGATHQMRIEW